MFPDLGKFWVWSYKWIATTYEVANTAAGAWQTGTNLSNGKFEFSDAFNLAPLAPFSMSSGVKRFLGGAMDVNGNIRSWGKMDVATEFSGACFVAGTKVLTPAGEQNIETIALGDTVISADPESGEIANHQVKNLFKTSVPVVLDIKVGEVTVTCSPEHPFWVPGEGWLEAGKLQPGTLLLTKEGATVSIGSIERREGCFTVYNVEVQGLHTYFVSELKILVHNKSARSPVGTDGGGITVYRIDELQYPRIEILEDGMVNIPDFQTKSGNVRELFINVDQLPRAQQFLRRRIKQNKPAVIKAFEVDPAFVEKLRREAVLESEVNLLPGPKRPVRVDLPTPDQYGLKTAEQIEELRGAIIQGTGRILD